MHPNRTDDVYIIMVSIPGYLPQSDPYAVRGVEAAFDCAKHEVSLSEDLWYDSLVPEDFGPDGEEPEGRPDLGMSLAEFASALEIGGGVSVQLDEWNFLDVTPLSDLGLPREDVDAYLEELDG